MKLNLSIIADALSKHNPQLYGTLNIKRTLRGVRLFHEETQHVSDYVYVIGKTNLKMLNEKEALTIICTQTNSNFINKLPDTWSLLQLDFESPLTTIKAVQDCFDFYSAWFEELQDLALHSAELQELLNVSARPLMNPIALHDPAFALIAMAGPDLPQNLKGSVWELIVKTGYSGLEFIPHNERVRLYEELRDKREPILTTPASIFTDKENVMVPIYGDDNWIATLASTDILHSFTPGQVALMHIIADILSTTFTRYEHIFNSEDKLAFAATRLIEKGLIKNSQLEHLLKKRHWKVNDTYRMLLLSKIANYSTFVKHEKFFIIKLKYVFTDALIFEYNEQIVIVINETQDKNIPDRQKKIVDELLARSESRMGVSFSIHDFRFLEIGYRQCLACIQFAEAQFLAQAEEDQPTQSTYFLEDIFCGAMIYSADATYGGACFCFPALLDYAYIQKDDGIELANIINVFLHNGRNILKTASELGIHRNTLMNKLTKIEQSLGFEFKDLTLQQHHLLMTTCLGILEHNTLSIARQALLGKPE